MTQNMNENQDASQYGVTPDIIEKSFDTDFEKSLESTFGPSGDVQGGVVKGVIVSVEKDEAVVDIGLKAEGRVSLKEFATPGETGVKLQVGDKVDVFVETIDGRDGQAVISREKARREEVLTELEDKFAKQEKVEGIIFNRVKGGFAVDLSGVLAFLPGSQLDVRPMKDTDHLMNTPIELMILKLDRKRGNVIVSRRALMDEVNSEARDEMLESMKEGDTLDGVVKNLTDYGAFIDLGGVDGLLHITDIAWHRINHPSEVLKMGQQIKVQVIRFDDKNKRVSLGLKQMSEDPWVKIENSFPLEAKVKGKVTNLTDYGAFVELAPGVEGLIHVSEMSWTRKNVHPSKVLSVDEEVDVMVLEIDRDKRRISLGFKQCQDNPWQVYAKTYNEGDVVEGTIRSITDFGIFVGLTDDIDGLIHVSDIAWDKSGEEAMEDYKKGQTIQAQIIALDPTKERVALGIKQMSEDTVGGAIAGLKKGQIVKATVTTVQDDGLVVTVGEVEAFIKARELGLERDAQDPSKYSEGDELEAKVTQISERDRKVMLSIRAKDVAEERAAVAEYTGKEEGGATLADALGDALGGLESADKKAEEKPKKKAAPKKEAKAEAEAEAPAKEEAKAEDTPTEEETK